MTVSLHVVEKLLIAGRMSKVDYRNKVLPNFIIYICVCVKELGKVS